MNRKVKNIILRISMFIGLTAFIVLAVIAKINREETRVKKITVSVDDWNGNFLVSKEQVLRLVENRFIVRDRILTGKDLERIEKSVAVIPQVKRSNAFTDNQGNLNIKVEQRNPVLRVYNLMGTSFYIDEDGMVFPVTDNYAAKVPVVSGNITELCDSVHRLQNPALKRVFNIARTVNKNSLWKAMIGQYNVNEKYQVELVPRFGKSIILLGDDKNVPQKIKRLDIFYFDVLKKVGWDYYRVINIMYKDQVVCLK